MTPSNAILFTAIDFLDTILINNFRNYLKIYLDKNTYNTITKFVRIASTHIKTCHLAVLINVCSETKNVVYSLGAARLIVLNASLNTIATK